METKTKVVIIGIFLIIVGIFIFAYFRGGTIALVNVSSVFLKILLVLVILAIIAGIVYFLFLYEKKINARLEVYKDIVKETKINRVHNLGNLWSAGDKEHTPIKYGQIIGYSIRQNYETYSLPNQDEKSHVKTYEYYFNETIFRVRRIYDNPLMDLVGLLFIPKLVVRCPSFLHDRLQGDVRLHCSTLVKHGNYYYPHNIHLNFKAIDKTIFNESMRFINMDIVRLAHPLIMKGMGVTKMDKQELEGVRGWDMMRGTFTGNKPPQMQ
jgi:hypothetical protein